LKITFLGTGAAEGIPAISCDCGHCTRAREENGKILRERNAVLFELPGYKLLIDTPPDIRDLINQYDITDLDGIFATNARYDHIGGIREFEYWQGNLDFLAEESLFHIVKREYWTDRLEGKMFHLPYYPGAPLYFSDFSLLPFAVRRSVPIFGVSIREKGGKSVVYTADTPSHLTNYARRLMMGADLLIVNTPTFEPPKEDHITVTEAVELKGVVNAKEMVLTYFSHRNRPHDILESFARQLMGVTIAYDGVCVEI